MKRLLFIILLLFVQVNTATAQRITRNFQNVSMSDALKYIQQQTGNHKIVFIYNELEDFTITTNVKNKPVPDAIRQIIGFYPIQMIQGDNNDIYVECILKTDHRLKGLVVDENNQPLSYANVTLLNPADSTMLGGGVTNESGRFVIPNDHGKVIARITYVGYKPAYRLCPHDNVGTIKLQPESKKLKETVVTSKMQIETADKVILVPTAALRKHAANALDLTDLMSVAGLLVSTQEKLVTTHTGGEVALCINGVAVRTEDVAMLQAQDVACMEYLRAPSGKWVGKAAVLNYIVRNSGGNVYLSADEGFIYQRGEYVAAVDYTRGKTKLRLAAISKWGRDHSYVEESGLYTFADSHQLTRYYSPDHTLARHHGEDVRFELTNKGDAHRFNLTLGLDASTVPVRDMTTAVIYLNDTTTMHRHANSKALSPNIFLEYTKWLPASQTIQFVASGSYGHNTYHSLYEETGQSAVTSRVKEDNFALAGQGLYFKTFANQLMLMLTAGHTLTNYKDHYSGTTTGYQHLVTNVTTAMLQLSRSTGSLSWYATAGVSNSAVSLNSKHYNYCSPIAYYGGTYAPRQDMSLSLNGVMTHTLFDPSNKNSMTLPVSFFEATQGNPDIEPLQVLSNTLSLSKLWGRHSLAVSYMSYIYFNNIVHQYYADPSVIYDKKLNDGNFYGNMLSASWSFSTLGDRLRVGLTGIGEYNAVRGDVYDLSRTIVRGRASVTWLQGEFKFGANFKTPSTQLDIREPFLVHDSIKLDFLVGWNHSGWSVELRLNNPFHRYYKSHEYMDYGCYDMDRWRMNETAGRNVSLKVTYALNFGKKTDRSDVQINPVINSAIMKPF